MYATTAFVTAEPVDVLVFSEKNESF